MEDIDLPEETAQLGEESLTPQTQDSHSRNHQAATMTTRKPSNP